jgi:hypothetical protein
MDEIDLLLNLRNWVAEAIRNSWRRGHEPGN